MLDMILNRNFQEPEKPKPPAEEKEPQMAHPFTPIPMPYAPLHEEKKSGKGGKAKSGEEKKVSGKKNRATGKSSEEPALTSNGIKVRKYRHFKHFLDSKRLKTVQKVLMNRKISERNSIRQTGKLVLHVAQPGISLGAVVIVTVFSLSFMIWK